LRISSGSFLGYFFIQTVIIKINEHDSYFIKIYLFKGCKVQKVTRTALLEYCKLDTWAMVKLLEKIDEVI